VLLLYCDTAPRQEWEWMGFMNLLRAGAAWLDRKRHEKLSEVVTYQRLGAGAGFAISATVGRTGSDQLIEGELVVGEKVRDYIFRAVDLSVSGLLVPPRRGDQVTAADGRVWGVVEIGGEECWRWSTEYADSIRVHFRMK
jgi:hypothetical protein